MDKSILIQKQIKDNNEDLHSFMKDMSCWEQEMKRKEAEITGVPYKKEIPPVRSKVKKQKSGSNPPKQKHRISGADYGAWDKFDADKACEDVDEEDIGPPSLDSEMSLKEKMEKLKQESQEEKEKGNQFVKQEKWDEAIACYSRAIELYKEDGIYYANRGLCHLKKENWHAADADCTKSLELDPTYVKALQRRVVARETLGSLRSAATDLRKVIELEPNNVAAKRQLATLTEKMGTKGPNYKTSPASTPSVTPSVTPMTTPSTENPPVLPSQKTVISNNIEEFTTNSNNVKSSLEEDDNIIHPINKPPYLRSKKPLVSISVNEIPLGCSKPISQKGKTNNCKSVPENLQNGDCNKIPNITPDVKSSEVKTDQKQNNSVDSINVINLSLEEKEVVYQIPKSSVQFLTQWKLLKGKEKAKSQYLKLIPPQDLPTIFQNFLESDVLSEILCTLSEGDDFVTEDAGATLDYLINIANVKRFSTLAMFLSSNDKQAIVKILKRCKDANKCSDDTVEQIKNKYEI